MIKLEVNLVIVMRVLIVKRDIEEIENKVLHLEVVIAVNLKKEKIIEIEVHLKKIVHKIERKIDIIVMKKEKRILVTAKIIIDL